MTSLIIQQRQTAIDAIIHIAVVILLAALLIPAPAHADCSKLIDKHLEYYNGIKEHLANRTSYDPGVKKLPYDAKIVDNNAQQYLLMGRNISLFYPNTAARRSDLGFQNGYIQAICIIETPDDLKWVVWQDEIRLWFYAEIENCDQQTPDPKIPDQ